MKEGDLVFAPFKQSMWPGKIHKKGMMAEIKFYKVKELTKVSTNSLVPFTQQKAAFYLDKNKDRMLVAAIKAAEKQFKGQSKRLQPQTVIKKEHSQDKHMKVENKEMKMDGRNGKMQSRLVKLEEINRSTNQLMQMDELLICKKEEQDDGNDRENPSNLPHCPNIFIYLCQLNQAELITDAKQTPLKQYLFVNTTTKKVERHLKEPRCLLLSLTEYLLTSLLTDLERPQILNMQKKIMNILGAIKFHPVTLAYSQLGNCMRLVISKKQSNELPLIDPAFIQHLIKSRKKLEENLLQFLDDYSELGPIIDRLTQ